MRIALRLSFVLFFSLVMLSAAPSTTQLTVHVVSDTGKPVDRASVVVRFVKGRDKLKFYKKMMTTWETRTNQDGRATVPQIPQGTIRIQIIASNFQTFGQIYDIDEAARTLEIKLNPPQPQYSAH